MMPITADRLVTAPHDVITEDQALIRARRARAARVVAAAATDAADCEQLLAALGLRPDEARPRTPAPRRGS